MNIYKQTNMQIKKYRYISINKPKNIKIKEYRNKEILV